ncbi:MAG: thiol reductant ABC exporter subunit CydD [Caulobacteraceae bacterium]|nr:thiol reductant ABC exporter subunit CydD [Caulobacteraceae bacterium]
MSRARSLARFRLLTTIAKGEPPLADLALGADVVLAVAFAWSLARALVLAPRGLAVAAPWIAAIVLAVSLRGVAAWAGLRLAAARARRIKRRLRRQVLEAALNLRPGAGRLVGETGVAVVDEVEALDGYFVRYAPARAAAVFGPVLVLAAAVTASPIAAGLLLATLIPFVALMILAGGAAAEASRRQLDALAKLSGLFADRVRSLPLVLAFQAEARETALIGRAAREVAGRTLSVLRIAFVSSAGLEFFAALSVALVAVYAGFSLLGLLPFKAPETLSFEHGFFVLALAPEFYGPMRRLAAAYHEKQLGEAAAVRLQAVLGAPRAATPAPIALAGAPVIRYRAASAAFADDPALRIGPVDFEVPAGGILALVGPTGSGKTTLLRLLVGEALLAEGEVEVAGHRLSQAGSFAPLVAWAGQAPILLPRSIGENVALAAPGAARERIAEVCDRAGLAEALAARPGGLDARLDERGSGLSGGERRRIGIARALLKAAPILILDEPTADLDEASETAMIAVIARAAEGRTVLIATHSDRLAAIAGQVVRL